MTKLIRCFIYDHQIAPSTPLITNEWITAFYTISQSTKGAYYYYYVFCDDVKIILPLLEHGNSTNENAERKHALMVPHDRRHEAFTKAHITYERSHLLLVSRVYCSSRSTSSGSKSSSS